MYCSFVADSYATVHGRAKANIYTEEPSFGGDDSRSINKSGSHPGKSHAALSERFSSHNMRRS